VNQTTLLHVENGEHYAFIGVTDAMSGRLEVQAATFGNRVHLFHQKDVRGSASNYFNNKDHRRLVGKARSRGSITEVISWDKTELSVIKRGPELNVLCVQNGEDISTLFVKVLMGQVGNIAQLALTNTAKKEG